MVDVIFRCEFLEVEIVFLYFGEDGFGDICDLLLIHVRCASEKRERFTYVVECSFKNTVFYLLKCRLYILMEVVMRIRSYSHFLQIIYKIVYIS